MPIVTTSLLCATSVGTSFDLLREVVSKQTYLLWERATQSDRYWRLFPDLRVVRCLTGAWREVRTALGVEGACGVGGIEQRVERRCILAKVCVPEGSMRTQVPSKRDFEKERVWRTKQAKC